MSYNFQRAGNLYAIDVDGKSFGLLLEMLTPDVSNGQVHVYLLNETGEVLHEVARPFGFVLKSLRNGIDVLEDMLKELADIAKNEGVNLEQTFIEIQKDVRQKR